MTRHRRTAVVFAAVLVAVIATGFAAQRADAVAAAKSVSCWSSLSAPSHVGSNVEATVTWQCTPGVMQQMAPLISLTAPDGTRYTHATQCYTTTYCTVDVSAPWSAVGNYIWTSRADYVYVVDGTGASSYSFGGKLPVIPSVKMLTRVPALVRRDPSDRSTPFKGCVIVRDAPYSPA